MPLQRYEHQGAAAATGLAAPMGAADVSLTLASGAGYPTGAGGKLFVLALDPGTTSEEKILCSARSGTTVTISQRGYDGTTATTHAVGTVNVQHVFSAAEADDDNDHIYTTTRDDHTQYFRVDGSRAGTGNFTTTGTIQGTAHIATLSATGRYVGSSNGSPTGGPYVAGDFADDPTNGTVWTCTVSGSPGTWRAGSPGRYSVKVYQTNGWTSTTGASNQGPFKFDTTKYDPTSMWNGTTGLITVPFAGVWSVKASIGTSTAANWITHIAVNSAGSLPVASSPLSTGTSTAGLVSSDIKLNASDTVSVFYAPGSGGQTGLTGENQTYLAVHFVGPAS